MSDGEKVTAGAILGVIFVMALAIKISQTLFPFFLILTVVSIIALLVLLVTSAINNNSGSDLPIIPVAIASGIFFLLALMTYFVGFGFGGTSIGQATVQVYDSVTGAQQQVSDSVWQSINQIVDSSCQELSKESCATLRTFAKTAKTVQEVSDLADKLKTAQRVARAVS